MTAQERDNAPVYPVTDTLGALLWLHPTCGNTQWHLADELPSYCGTCCCRTDRWVQMFAGEVTACGRE